MRGGLWTIMALALVAGDSIAADNEHVSEIGLPEPTVIMEADPVPPFTYWVPEGATVRNHPRIAGIWIAQIDEGAEHYYYGDACLASKYQGYIGQPLDSLPVKPSKSEWRLACTTCAIHSDLGWERMNVFFDDKTQLIAQISCG